MELVNICLPLQDESGSLYHSKPVISRADVPERTDTGNPVPYQKNKHVLFGQQEGGCNGCGQDGMGSASETPPKRGLIEPTIGPALSLQPVSLQLSIEEPR